MTTPPPERQVVLDVETTGLDAARGNRVIEVGCVEIVGRRITGRVLQRYVDPERDIEEGALRVHGIDRARLRGEPKFAAILDELLAFVRDADVLIHNAPFDLGFLDAELERAGRAEACDRLAPWFAAGLPESAAALAAVVVLGIALFALAAALLGAARPGDLRPLLAKSPPERGNG